MLYNLHFFSSKCRLFHNSILFGFCIIHILNTGCAKIWKKKSVAKRLTSISSSLKDKATGGQEGDHLHPVRLLRLHGVIYPLPNMISLKSCRLFKRRQLEILSVATRHFISNCLSRRLSVHSVHVQLDRTRSIKSVDQWKGGNRSWKCKPSERIVIW